MSSQKQIGNTGVRQRLKLAKHVASKASPVRGGALGRQLVDMYAKGTISPARVGDAAGAASGPMGAAASSSAEAAGLQRLAKARPKKGAPRNNNTSRALRRALDHDEERSYGGTVTTPSRVVVVVAEVVAVVALVLALARALALQRVTSARARSRTRTRTRTRFRIAKT